MGPFEIKVVCARDDISPLLAAVQFPKKMPGQHESRESASLGEKSKSLINYSGKKK